MGAALETAQSAGQAAPELNVLLNVVQVAALVALLKWINKGNGNGK